VPRADDGISGKGVCLGLTMRRYSLVRYSLFKIVQFDAQLAITRTPRQVADLPVCSRFMSDLHVFTEFSIPRVCDNAKNGHPELQSVTTGSAFVRLYSRILFCTFFFKIRCAHEDQHDSTFYSLEETMISIIEIKI
jgi:hypothetical protein